MNQDLSTVVIDSREMGQKWKKEFRLSREGEALRCVVIFREKVPETVKLTAILAAPKTQFEFVSVFLGKSDTKLAIDLALRHEAANTRGRALFKAALRDSSRVDFKGMLYIAQGADGSDSYLNARALMLSKKAIARIDPQLEILANDIKASHGSTVGRLGPQDLFYLQSRGITEKDAERILLRGYFTDVLAYMPEKEKRECEEVISRF